MALLIEEISRTFNEYLLLPNLTRRDDVPANVNLRTPVVRYRRGEAPALSLNIPFCSATMQAVSGPEMAIALARSGGISFIYCSQPIGEQVEMVRKVKRYKAGFVMSDANVRPDATLRELIALTKKTGHSTVPVTDDGTANGKFIGLITRRDYSPEAMPPETKVSTFMGGLDSITVSHEGITLKEANAIIGKNKLTCLPILSKDGKLAHLVFRRDYTDHMENPRELTDPRKRLVVGAGVNTRDYRERVPALVEAGADLLCVDSSDGFSEWQADAIAYIKEKFGDAVKVGAGNIVDRDGFNYLADAGADFVKVGIGGGSICITREQKGIGRGQASALLDVAKARAQYLEEKQIYVPICSDGGIVHDYHTTLALAMGADFIMMGRYFARFDESPGKKIVLQNRYVKEYWAEGSFRARNWQRYDLGGSGLLSFEEGVDSYVPYAGPLKEGLNLTLSKLISTMCNCGCRSIADMHAKARITLVSSTSIIEGGAHDVILRETEGGARG